MLLKALCNCPVLTGSITKTPSQHFRREKKQLLRIMKITAIILLLACLTASATGFSQKVSLHVKDATLETVFKEIKKQSGYDFWYETSLLQQAKKVTIQVKNTALTEVLNLCFKDQPLSYTIVEQTIVVKEKPVTIITEAMDQSNYADSTITIRGRVLSDSTHLPVDGASVTIKGTKRGTSTDAEGVFRLNVSAGDVLVISHVEYKSVEYKITPAVVASSRQAATNPNQQSIPGTGISLTISLKKNTNDLQEVVLNGGYYTTTQRLSTGSISKITAEKIEKQPVSNPLAALEGRMPGVFVQQTTGVPGGGFTIQIRGRNSLRDNGNDPLYIIDGVPFTPTPLTSTTISGSIIKEGSAMASINPTDIESIEILKDADATAIYGSRGANGVILITTKRGKSGKTKFDININQGIGKVSNTLDVLNTQEYVRMRISALQNDGFWPLSSSSQPRFPDIFSWDSTRYTDWQKVFIGGTANTTNAQATVSGGTANTQFALRGGYYKESTVFPGDYYFQRGSGSLALNHISDNKKFRAAASVNYTSSLNNLLSFDLTGIAITMAPDAPQLYNSDGSTNWDWKNNFYQNPVSYLKKKYQSNTYNFITNALFTYNITSELSLRANAGYTNMDVAEVSTNPLSSIPTQFLQGQTASSSFGNNTIRTWIVEPQAEYVKHVGTGRLSILVGTTFQQSKQEGQTLTARGFTSDALLENIRAATSIEISSSDYFLYRYSALFGRANFSLKDKYIFNLTARRDGSSRFGPGKQFGNFGAIGGAWIFTNENFIKTHLPFLSFGKIRASYGTTGNDAIGNYQYLNTYTATTYPYNNTTGLVVTRLDNPDFSWETNKKLETNIDLGFFKDRIVLSANWYHNRSSNQLVGFPLPVITGQSSVQFNLPATVENDGWEFQLTSLNINAGKFRWTTDFNISFPKNKLIEFPNLDAFPAYKNLYKVGESIFTKKTLKATGVDPSTGLYTFEDVNGDGSISITDDGLFLKKVTQQYFGGLNNSFVYKGFQLDAFFQFVKQSGYNYLNSFGSPGTYSNQPTEVLQRWQKAGDITTIQRYSLTRAGNAAYSNVIFSDNIISDASFIRLKNISLSWQLPSDWARKAKLENCKVYVQAQNLFTITNYLGLDPENQNISFLPPLRVIAMGIQLTF